MKNTLIGLIDRAIQLAGLRLMPAWRVQWWTAAQRFQLADRDYECFYHGYNCGWPPYSSERCVELAIADHWLKPFQPDEVIEVGAVTPYYWPHRITTVVDPFDEHKLVSNRESLFRVTFDRPVLSISTFEHIGMGDYGSIEAPDAVLEAFAKLFAEAKQFLVTVPVGYNPIVDNLLFDTGVPDDVSLNFVVRNDQGGWQSAKTLDEGRRPYGDPMLKAQFPNTSIGVWANCVAVLERQLQRTK